MDGLSILVACQSYTEVELKHKHLTTVAPTLYRTQVVHMNWIRTFAVSVTERSLSHVTEAY